MKWADDAVAYIKKLWQGPDGDPPGPEPPVPGGTTSTQGTLTAANGDKYTFESTTDESGIYCPKQPPKPKPKSKGKGQVKSPSPEGVVELHGVLGGTRTFTLPGSGERTEHFLEGYTVTGHVNDQAQLVSYDVAVNISGSDASGRPFSMQASELNMRPRPTAGTQPVVDPSKVALESSRQEDLPMAVAALDLASKEAVKYLQDAQSVFDKEQSCIAEVSTPSIVKRGTTQVVKVHIISKLTGKRVEGDVIFHPTGGATVTPETAHTTTTKDAEFTVTMPGRHSGRAAGAGAAASPSVDIVALSAQGRATGTIGSDDLPAAYKIDLNEASTTLATNGAYSIHGTLVATVTAPRWTTATTQASPGSAPHQRASATSRWQTNPRAAASPSPSTSPPTGPSRSRPTNRPER